ncbi:hypothetical protein PR048_008002 [Dryococelus australis]|uniref:Cytochrome P450 n=1 Tax=Dryococelus australis TaxID=614101 RepID=A0ABQ9HVV7_9NEOP|nr:hypothetical protein PR048_008002 [Dryococelus australis]
MDPALPGTRTLESFCRKPARNQLRHEDFFDASLNLADHYGSLLRIWSGPYLFVAVLDPRYLDVVLSSNAQFEKSANYRFLLPWIDRGLLTLTGKVERCKKQLRNEGVGAKVDNRGNRQTSGIVRHDSHIRRSRRHPTKPQFYLINYTIAAYSVRILTNSIELLCFAGQQWKKHRRIITPTFHFQNLENFLEVVHSNGHKMIEKLKIEVDGPDIDISQYISLCTLDIIAETGMGITIDAQDNDEADFVRATRTMGNIVILRAFKLLYYWDPPFQLLPTGKLQKDSLQVPHALSTQQDHDPRHDALKTREKLLYITPGRLNTPPQSPDFNPIKNLWHMEIRGSMTGGSVKLPTRPTLAMSASVHLVSHVRNW